MVRVYEGQYNIQSLDDIYILSSNGNITFNGILVDVNNTFYFFDVHDKIVYFVNENYVIEKVESQDHIFDYETRRGYISTSHGFMSVQLPAGPLPDIQIRYLEATQEEYILGIPPNSTILPVKVSDFQDIIDGKINVRDVSDYATLAYIYISGDPLEPTIVYELLLRRTCDYPIIEFAGQHPVIYNPEKPINYTLPGVYSIAQITIHPPKELEITNITLSDDNALLTFSCNSKYCHDKCERFTYYKFVDGSYHKKDKLVFSRETHEYGIIHYVDLLGKNRTQVVDFKFSPRYSGDTLISINVDAEQITDRIISCINENGVYPVDDINGYDNNKVRILPEEINLKMLQRKFWSKTRQEMVNMLIFINPHEDTYIVREIQCGKDIKLPMGITKIKIIHPDTGREILNDSKVIKVNEKNGIIQSINVNPRYRSRSLSCKFIGIDTQSKLSRMYHYNLLILNYRQKET